MSAVRRRTPSTSVEAALLAAARDLLEEEGPLSLTIRQIAARAGVAPMGVYSRFASKSGIVDALFREGFTELAAGFATLDAATEPSMALLEAGQHYRDQALAHPAMYQVMFSRSVPGFEPSDAAKADALAAFDVLVGIIRRCIAAGVLRDDDPAEMAQIFWSACHGWVALEIAGIGFVSDPASGYEALCRTLLEGLRPPSIS